jgi:protein-S-isoprenylcysteine O-methyltransferase Ste14
MVFWKSLLFAVLVPGTSVVLVPYLLLYYFGTGSPVSIEGIRYAGLPMIILGAMTALWCMLDFARKGKGTPAPFDPPRKLVLGGLYRWVRNPMYIGILLLLVGEALYFEAPSLLVYTLIVFVCFHLFVVAYEEPKLKEKFGDSYTHYCHTVPRWIPRKKKIR